MVVIWLYRQVVFVVVVNRKRLIALENLALPWNYFLAILSASLLYSMWLKMYSLSRTSYELLYALTVTEHMCTKHSVMSYNKTWMRVKLSHVATVALINLVIIMALARVASVNYFGRANCSNRRSNFVLELDCWEPLWVTRGSFANCGISPPIPNLHFI